MATYAQIYDAQQPSGDFWKKTYVAVQKAAQALRTESVNVPLRAKRFVWASNALRETTVATNRMTPLIAALLTDPTLATDVDVQNNVNGVLSLETQLDILV